MGNYITIFFATRYSHQIFKLIGYGQVEYSNFKNVSQVFYCNCYFRLFSFLSNKQMLRGELVQEGQWNVRDFKQVRLEIIILTC